ncbi:hypothetical protein [Burkholderia arboris]|uniref:hypothetical protein n=1 Tax=Burkholderia arboris TaxID=488730 RepID=UPI00210C77D6|nr:hypothetical protein [Burkholderia arboris]UTV53232.1 hypothetical protein NLX30_10040 [Burkholderia arboris]
MSAGNPSYLPTLPRLSQEVIATTVGVILAAWIISRFPKAKALVDGNSIWNTEKTLFPTSGA